MKNLFMKMWYDLTYSYMLVDPDTDGFNDGVDMQYSTIIFSYLQSII